MQIPLEAVPADYKEKIAVLHVVDTPLEKMTVGEICRKSGISRKKFYTLFESKYGIMYWYLEFCFSVSLYEIGKTLTWHEGIKTCLELVEQERSFFLADYANHVDKKNSYYWPLDTQRVRIIEETLEQRGFAILPKSLRIEITLYSKCVPDLIRYWIQSDSSLDLDEYTELWTDSVPRKLYKALELKNLKD